VLGNFSCWAMCPAPSAAAIRPVNGYSERRSSTEISALVERRYEEICATPGESMRVLSGKLEKGSGALEFPMRWLLLATKGDLIKPDQKAALRPQMLCGATPAARLLGHGS